MNGPKRQIASNATASPFWCGASWTTAQARAMFCIQVPATEVSWPKKNSR